jgi:hypothetical protein
MFLFHFYFSLAAKSQQAHWLARLVKPMRPIGFLKRAPPARVV